MEVVRANIESNGADVETSEESVYRSHSVAEARQTP